jgi:alkanesulfonate monooxygenase SsuD/methylene tetrahydromethanopterin reductase-like flavin-dependent oxidoreductase (luciferase family)
MSRRPVLPGMRLGAFTVVDPDPDGPDADRVRSVVRLAELAEEAGLSSLWVAEHHFAGGGGCPSPAVLLAACGMRTRSLRLGSLVSVLPFHRPVDIAEEYALVDRLTGGRLNFGVGSGYLASEFAGYGLDPTSKRERFDAALPQILAALSGAPIDAGPPGTPAVRLNVEPVQKPHPPVWIAVQRREAIPHVARQGWSIALIPYATVNDLDELEDEIAEYRRELPGDARSKVAAAVHIYGGEHVAVARAAFHRYVQARHASGSTFLVRKARDHPEHASPEAIEASGLALLGSPGQVVEGLERFVRLGVDELLGIFDFGGLPTAEIEASVRAVGAAWAHRPPLAERVRERGGPGA